jgi:hypothetical protein
MQLGLCQCRIFEAGESDMDYTDDAAGNHAPASSSNNAQHAEPVSAIKVAGLLNTANVQDVVDFLDWPVQAMQQMGSATPGGVQGPLPFRLQQQQQQRQQLLVQQQFAMQQQQHQQVMMQQQVCYCLVDIFQYRLSHQLLLLYNLA